MTAKECIARAEAESLTLGALSLAIESENGGSMENSLDRLSAMLSVMEAEVENALTAPVLSVSGLTGGDGTCMNSTEKTAVPCWDRFRHLPPPTHYPPLRQTPRWAGLSPVRPLVPAELSRHVCWRYPGYETSRGKRCWKPWPAPGWSAC